MIVVVATSAAASAPIHYKSGRGSRGSGNATIGRCWSWRRNNGSSDAVAGDMDSWLAHARRMSSRASDDDFGLVTDLAADGGDDKSRGNGGGGIISLVANACLGDSVSGHPPASLTGGRQDSLVNGGELCLGDGRAIQESRGGSNVCER